jgi:asparagine synthase (glutamine-hydrolysing)
MIGIHNLKDAKTINLKEAAYEFRQIEDLSIHIQGRITGVYDVEIDYELYKDKEYELISKLYKEYGKEFHKYLNGHFIIFIKTMSGVSIYNNRYNSTNLYYYFDDNYFIYSKKLKILLNHLPVERKIDKTVLKTFLSNGWNPTDKTLFKGIFKILPTYRIIATNKVEIENHWNEELSFDRKPFGNLEKHMDEYESIYRNGIKEYTSSKGTQELGTLLSGGHDTSFALIQGSKVHDKPMHSFTVTFPGWAFDEGPFAKNLSNKFNSIHHEVPFKPEDLDYMPSLIVANEEPVVGSSLPLHLCSKEAANHVDTMLGGDGGDTMWGEYFPVAEFHRYIKNLPLSSRKLIHNFSAGLRKTFDWERLWELEHVSELFAHEDMYDSLLRRLCTYRHFSDDFIDQLLKKDEFSNTSFARSSLELLYNKDNFADMLIESKLFNGFYNYQAYHTHKSVEHFGMELYLPTINRDFLRFITDLPMEWVNGGTTFHRLTNSHSINRRFHKKVLSRYLKKEEIFSRSFDIPWYNILRPRAELLNKLKKRLIARGWFNTDIIESMFSEFLSQKVKDYELLELKHHGYRIFTLLSLEIWCIEYLDERNTTNYDDKVTLEDYLSI